MKVFFLGPVTTRSYIGGVANFNEGLAVGFCKNGWQSVLVTNQKEAVKLQEKNGIPIRYISNRQKFQRLAKEEKPDVIITCLAYAKYLKRKAPMKKIYFLHAFFNRSYYGLLKATLAVPYQKWLIRKCDYVFANSYFTSMINCNFYGIKANHVFYPAASEVYMKSVEKVQELYKKEVHTITFVGRLVSCKKVDMLLEALVLLSEQNVEYRAYIVGGGAEMSRLKKIVEKYRIPVVFTGVKDQTQIAEYYWRSEVFVSLDDREPFGIVFLEALLAECKIVCPYTGGQVEYLDHYRQSVSYVDCYSPVSIAEGIKQMFEKGIAPCLSKEQRESYSYQTVSARIIDYMSL